MTTFAPNHQRMERTGARRGRGLVLGVSAWTGANVAAVVELGSLRGTTPP